MKRLLALLLALAMVGAALYVRNTRDDDGEGEGNGAVLPEPEGPARLVCATELRDVCDALADAEVTVEDAATTFDRLTQEGDPELDGWLVFGPWPAMVDGERARATLDPLFGEATRPLARTRLAAVGPVELGGCNWRCLGDRAGSGELTLGMPDPQSGLGVVIVGAASAGWFDRSDFATNDFEAPFEDWLSTMVAQSVVAPSPVQRLLQDRAFFDVALSTQANAVPQLDQAAPQRKEGLDLLYPDPVASVDVVLAGGGDALGDELSERLLETGWSAPDQAPTGLPSPGVLLALRVRL